MPPNSCSRGMESPVQNTWLTASVHIAQEAAAVCPYYLSADIFKELDSAAFHREWSEVANSGPRSSMAPSAGATRRLLHCAA